MTALFFGCWNGAGHFWWQPGGERVVSRNEPIIRRIDGGYAPRRWRSDLHLRRHLVKNPACCFIVEQIDEQNQRHIEYDTVEYEQGAFAIHPLLIGPNFEPATLMSWWDRTQGDTRPGCNSNLLVSGVHNAADMHIELLGGFPRVQSNLTRAGIILREATR